MRCGNLRLYNKGAKFDIECNEALCAFIRQQNQQIKGLKENIKSLKKANHRLMYKNNKKEVQE